MKKRILLTFGPCATKIDKVRFILNSSTGETGKEILKELLKRKLEIDCIVFKGLLKKKTKVNLFEYFFFEEFKSVFLKLLKNKKYDIIIHLSALPDFKLEKEFKKKIDSKKPLVLKLIPTEKLIDKIRKFQKKAIICGFKLSFSKNILKKALELKKRAKLNIVVANTYNEKNNYKALIITENKILGPFNSKRILAKELIKTIL